MVTKISPSKWHFIQEKQNKITLTSYKKLHTELQLTLSAEEKQPVKLKTTTVPAFSLTEILKDWNLKTRQVK